MLVDVYEKTRTIEVPDGDKTVKVCKIDQTGLGYSTEAEIFTIQRGGYSLQPRYSSAIIEKDSNLSKHMEYLESRITYESKLKAIAYDVFDEGDEKFMKIIENCPIRGKAKKYLVSEFRDCFTGLRKGYRSY